MSEDSGIICRNKLQTKEERECTPDFCGSLGKGMLENEKFETLGRSSGLTPIGFGVDVHNRNMDRENTELKRTGTNSGSVSSYRVSTGSLLNFSATDGLETFRNSSGLTPLDFDIKPQINADKRRCGCIGIENNEKAELELNFSDRSVPLNLRREFHKRGVI